MGDKSFFEIAKEKYLDTIKEFYERSHSTDFIPVTFIGTEDPVDDNNPENNPKHNIIYADTLEFTEENKYNQLVMLGRIAYEEKLNRIVLCFDSYTRKIKNKKDLEYTLENIDTESPSTYPESMRQSSFCFIDIDFKKPNGTYMSTLDYSLDGDKMTFGKYDGSINCSGLFRSYIEAGFFMSLLKDNIPDEMVEHISKDKNVDMTDCIKKTIGSMYSRIKNDYRGLDTEDLKDKVSFINSEEGKGTIRQYLQDKANEENDEY